MSNTLPLGTSFGTTYINTGSTGMNTGGSSANVLGGVSIVGNLLGGFQEQLTNLGNLINCWGATWKPQRAEDFINTNFPIYQADLTLALQQPDPISAINQAGLDLRRKYSRDEAWLKRCDNPATGCSKTTLTAMCDQLLSGIKQTLMQVSPQVSADVKKTTIEHAFWTSSVSPKCGETFEHYKLEKKAIISNPFTGGTGALGNGLKLFGSGLILPFALIGTLLYWVFSKNDNKKKRKQF